MRMALTTDLTAPDADRILNLFNRILPHIPTSIWKFLRNSGSCSNKLVGNGIYYYTGIKVNLLCHLECWFDCSFVQVYLHKLRWFMFWRARQQLWSILGRICSPFVSDIFIIGIYGGVEKSCDTEIFKELVTKITDVCQRYLRRQGV